MLKAAAKLPSATQLKAPAAQPKLPSAQPKVPAEVPAAAAAAPQAAWDLDRFGSDSEEALVDDDSDTGVEGPPPAAAAVKSRPAGAKGGRQRGDMLLCPVVKPSRGAGRV